MDENQYCYLFLRLHYLRLIGWETVGPRSANSASCEVGYQPETEALSLGGLEQLWPAYSGKAGILGGGLILQIPSLELSSAIGASYLLFLIDN